MLYFIRALRQIRFLLRQRNNNVYKQLENSMIIPVAVIINGLLPNFIYGLLPSNSRSICS